jgi:hypothetical protein
VEEEGAGDRHRKRNEGLVVVVEGVEEVEQQSLLQFRPLQLLTPIV